MQRGRHRGSRGYVFRLTALARRKSELATMQDRLLNAYLANTIDEATYNAKSAELKSETLKAEEEIEKLNDVQSLDADLGLRLFDWSQNVAESWLGSNNCQEREILDLLCLNRAMSDVSLLLAKRKPFDFLSERLKCQSSREFRGPVELFLASVAEWDAHVSHLVLAA